MQAIDQVEEGEVRGGGGHAVEARPVAVWAGGACRGRRALPPGSRARLRPFSSEHVPESKYSTRSTRYAISAVIYPPIVSRLALFTKLP